MTPPSLPALPRILLVEDDPVSGAFLTAALAALPAEVDLADTVAAALRLSRRVAHQLWLIDANLPDGNGRDLLRALRNRASPTPAIAHTASGDRADFDALIDAGFAEVLVKPLAASALQATVRRCLQLQRQPAPAEPPTRHGGKLPVWDDTAAVQALNGSHAHVAALRGLFLAELPAQREAVLSALLTLDADSAHAHLHRMQASCGFVGAARLGAAVAALQRLPLSARAREEFEHAIDDLLATSVTLQREP